MTGITSLDHAASWAVWLSVLTAGFTVLGRILHSVVRIAARMDDMWQDWEGVQPRPGTPGRPGVMERIRSLENEVYAGEEHKGGT